MSWSEGIRIRSGGAVQPFSLLRVTAVVLSVAVLVATAILKPGVFGTLGLFAVAGILFLMGVVFALLKAGRDIQRQTDRTGDFGSHGSTH